MLIKEVDHIVLRLNRTQRAISEVITGFRHHTSNKTRLLEANQAIADGLFLFGKIQRALENKELIIDETTD